MGGAWVWCSSCRRCHHDRRAIPGWWTNDPSVPLDVLTSLPTALDELADFVDRHWNAVRASEEGERPAGRTFSVGQRTAVAGAFALAGYEGPIMVPPVMSEDECAFLLDPAALTSIRHPRTLEQVLQQLLGLKVVVVERRDSAWGTPVPFA